MMKHRPFLLAAAAAFALTFSQAAPAWSQAATKTEAQAAEQKPRLSLFQRAKAQAESDARAEAKDADKPKKQAKASDKKAQEKKSAAKANDKKPAAKADAKAAAAEAPKPARKPVPFMFGLFDAPKPEPVALSEEQVTYDQKIASVPEKKRFKVKDEFAPQTVPFKGYKPGTIVIDTKTKHLYFVESPVSAIRYGVAVGKEGLLFTGKATVGAKQPWPKWIPTKEMIARDPGKYARYADGMDGGPKNPLGARAIYLYQGKQDTYLRIHGTTAPETIGTASSNGCFRMINEHVIDLYDRVQMGAEVVVL